MGITIDRCLNEVENACSTVAAIPVVGIVAGGFHAMMGLTQLLAGSCGCLLNLMSAPITKDWSLASYSWHHMKHGAGNIVSGAFEAIPLVGTGMFFWRQKQAAVSGRVYISTHHENKWMPYSSLVARDWKIEGSDDAAVSKVTQIVKGKLVADGSPDLHREKEKKFAQAAIGQEAAEFFKLD
jgi:hypothetical protein